MVWQLLSGVGNQGNAGQLAALIFPLVLEEGADHVDSWPSIPTLCEDNVEAFVLLVQAVRNSS